MQFRTFLLHAATRVLRDLGPQLSEWVARDVSWDPSGATPPAELLHMTFELTSLYDVGSPQLALLRQTTASVALTVDTACRDGERYQVAVPVADEPSRAYAELASQLQDHAAESADAWAVALPGCPRHDGRHPLSPRDTLPRASWWCPNDNVVVRLIPAT